MENHREISTTDVYHNNVSDHFDEEFEKEDLNHHDIHERNHINATEIDEHHDFTDFHDDDHHSNHSFHANHAWETLNHTDHDHELQDHHNLHHDHEDHMDNNHVSHFHDDHHVNHSLHDDHHADHHGHDPIHKYIEISIAAAAVLGNILVIYVIFRSKKMRAQFTNWLIINQSVLDLLFGVLIILVNIGGNGQLYSGAWWQFYCRVIWSKWTCRAVKVSSSYNLVAISLERYMMAVHPLRYRNFVKPKYLVAAIATVWSIGNIVPIFAVFTTKIEHGICKILHFWPSTALFATFGVANAIVMVIVPIGIMLFVYFKIYKNIRRHGMKVHIQVANESNVVENNANMKKKNAREMNILATAVIVVICYAICNIPETVRILVAGATDVYTSHNVGALGMITIILFHLDCAINPIIYTAKYELFRKEFVKYVFCNKIKLSEVSTSTSDNIKTRSTLRTTYN